MEKVNYFIEKGNHLGFISVNVSLGWFLGEEVLNRLIKTETLCALSMNNIDVEDVVCVNRGICVQFLEGEVVESFREDYSFSIKRDV